MTTHQIPGFVPKKLVTERYNRSFRQLTRDVALAMQAKDEKILGHFKLVLDDGEPIEGIDVTTERIAQLRDGGRNPMWFVEENWMASTYGSRFDRPEEMTSNKTDHAEVRDEPSPQPQLDILTLYERQVERLEQQVEHLRTEGTIKNEQIRDASERQKELNVLTRDLHGLMNTMQERLLPAPQPAASTRETTTVDSKIVDPRPASKVATGSNNGKSAGRKTTGPSRRAKKTHQPTKRNRKKQTVTVFEKHTPTLYRAFSGILRRS